MALPFQILWFLVVIRAVHLRFTLTAAENIANEESVQLFTDSCRKCTDPKAINKDCQECKSLLKACDPQRATGPIFGQVPNISVTFHNNLATITWEPINVTGKVGAANWTGYYVMWDTLTAEPSQTFSFNGSCVKLGKNEPRVVVLFKKTNWTRQSDTLLVNVLTAPMPRYTGLAGYTFFPGNSGDTEVPIPTKPTPKMTSSLPVLSILGGSIAGLLLVLALVALAWFRKWIILGSPTTNGYDFHVFVSYSRQDETFLSKTLLPLLDKHEIEYCIDFKDWSAGIPWQENLVLSLKKSRKVLFVASSSFLEKKNCLKEIDQAVYWRGDSSDVIVLRIDSFDIKLLPRALRGRTFIDYNSKLERITWQARLIKALQTSPILSQYNQSINLSS